MYVLPDRMHALPATPYQPAVVMYSSLAQVDPMKKILCMLCASLVSCLVVVAQSQEAPSTLKNYKPVTAQRLLKPEDGDWLMIRRTYDGWGYSPLEKITTANVGRLKQVWKVDTGEARVHESAPVVNNGVLFVTTPNNQVLALDGKTGAVLWR